eukprot:1058640-Rhodomonas_salina.1
MGQGSIGQFHGSRVTGHGSRVTGHGSTILRRVVKGQGSRFSKSFVTEPGLEAQTEQSWGD